MSKKASKSIISIGFIDLLTGFLCSTAALMIIIKYGAEQSGDIAGGPKDYIYYSGAVEFLNPGETASDLNDLMIQLIIKTPEGEWLESAVDESGMDLNESGFIAFDNYDYYGLGPSSRLGQPENKHYFHIYGISEVNPGDQWEIGLRYYSNRLLEEQRERIDPGEISRLLATPLKITHSVQHIAQAENAILQQIDTLGFGGDSSIEVTVFNEQ